MHAPTRTAKRVVFGASFCFVMFGAAAALAAPRTHDGFYMQGAAGLGYLTTNASSIDHAFSGLTLPMSFLLGGSPIPGLVIGGGVLTDYSFSPKWKIRGQEQVSALSSQYLIGIGPFVDFYPNPTGGLHFQGMFGWGGLESSFQGNVGGSDPTGFIFALGGGHDWWIGDQWSVGVLGRIAVAPLSLAGVGYMTIAPALLATITYH
jgi:hypothetical protein